MLDLGITTYLFLIINFGLLITGVLRVVLAFAFTITSTFIFAQIKDITFTPLISETMFIGLNEIATFTLGILAGFKNNIRLMYTFEFLVALLLLAKVLSIRESVKDEEIVNEDLQLNLEDMMNDFRSDEESEIRSHVTGIQTFFHCCGYASPKFYGRKANENLDKSCCPESQKDCTPSNAYKKGCKDYVHVPHILFDIHYYTLFPICEVILFVLGAALITFIKQTARRILA